MPLFLCKAPSFLGKKALARSQKKQGKLPKLFGKTKTRA